uniref:Putative c2h2-type zn-finger protein n=1 Tax=Culex tarsalis TaxID=7177 RepID=A0A1Q3F295_CULTA
MPIFRLERYPFVCRLCLKPEQHRKMTALDTEDECFGGSTYEDYLATFTFQVEEEKRHLFPRSICPPCKDLLRMYARFRAKVRQVHLFMNALVELRDFNTVPMRSLFTSSKSLKTSLRAMLMELGICQSDHARAKELINEFPQYRIAGLPAVLERSGFAEVDVKEEANVEPPKEVEKVEEDEEASEEEQEDVLFAEECSPEELLGLTGEIVTEDVKVEENVETTQVQTGVKWEFLDDSDEEMDVPKKVSARRKAAAKKPEPKRKRHDWEAILAKPPTLESIGDPKAALASRKYGGPSSKEPLQCPKCPYKTHLKGTFHSHQLTHLVRENKLYTCKEPDCSAQFTNRRHLASHVEKQHRFWICDECGIKCSCRSHLSIHKARHHSTTPPSFSCEYCQQSFKLKLDVQAHIRRVHMAETLFKCGTCGLEFKRKCTLLAHESRHSNVYNFQCEQCDKKFKLKAALGKHIRTVHSEPGFQCEHCNKPFYKHDNMLNHIEHAHGIQMRFVCDICVASLDSAEKLATHKLRHENPKMFECARCLLVFATQELFFDHLCITYRDDYVCCDRDFRDHQPYNRHVFLRHGVKVNARVKPQPGVLLGQLRAQRKRVEICQRCDACFPTRILKKQHQETCRAGGENGL